MTNRLGERHIFGVFVPDFNSVVEPELAELRVQGITNQTTRFALDAAVIENIVIAAERLVPSGVTSWIIGLATESFPGGAALLEQATEALRERTGLDVHSPTWAVVRGLRELSAKTISIVTPFDEAANAYVRSFYEDQGFKVAALIGLNRPGFDEIASATDEETTLAFQTAAASPSDALVQVGTGLPMLHLIDPIENRFKMPVVSSNAATYWLALRDAGSKILFRASAFYCASTDPNSACSPPASRPKPRLRPTTISANSYQAAGARGTLPTPTPNSPG